MVKPQKPHTHKSHKATLENKKKKIAPHGKSSNLGDSWGCKQPKWDT